VTGYLLDTNIALLDRALIAQAISEDMALVTMDTEIRKYASSRFRVVS
jgi:hypothetical protein